MSPRVSPRMRAAPDASSLICSMLWKREPSRRAWYSQVFLRYRFRMWQRVESAVSSTAADGILHTAMPTLTHTQTNMGFVQMHLSSFSLTPLSHRQVYSGIQNELIRKSLSVNESESWNHRMNDGINTTGARPKTTPIKYQEGWCVNKANRLLGKRTMSWWSACTFWSSWFKC